MRHQRAFCMAFRPTLLAKARYPRPALCTSGIYDGRRRNALPLQISIIQSDSLSSSSMRFPSSIAWAPGPRVFSQQMPMKLEHQSRASRCQNGIPQARSRWDPIRSTAEIRVKSNYKGKHASVENLIRDLWSVQELVSLYKN